MPTARIYLPLICRKRFFSSALTLIPIRFLRQPDRWVPTKPLHAERMNPFPTTLFLCRQNITTEQASPFPTRCGAKLSIALVLRETSWFLPMPRTGLPQNSATHLCYAKRYGFCQCLEPGCRKTQQRTCVTRGNHGFCQCPEPGCRKTQQRTDVWRGNHGFHQCLEPGNRNIRIRSCVNSPLKK